MPGQQFRLPSWIPGSYLLREYARHVVAVSAEDAAGSVAVGKLDHSTWQCRSDGGRLRFRLRVHAHDLSVRGAFLDTRRAYFNGPCLFPEALGQADVPVSLELTRPTAVECADWRVATAMMPVSIDDRGFGSYRADDYAELLDHPFEISHFYEAAFTAGGIPHRLVIAGVFDSDIERIAQDLARICAAQISFFGEPAPFDSYLFICLVTGSGYGGLEHRASTSLICSRGDLPGPRDASVSAAYQRFLGLASHEYFHTWHVKRIKPLAFQPYRLNERNHTRLLWVFEGITTYYQEVFLLRSGLIGHDDFLRRLAETLTRVYRVPGRHLQSVAEASFEAWDMLYKPESNSVNSTISYYSKGALVALALDLLLRARDRISLDTLLKALWERFGRQGRGLPENGFEVLAAELATADLSNFFDQAVRGSEDLPLEDLFADCGIAMTLLPRGSTADGTADSQGAWLGIQGRGIPGGTTAEQVFLDSPAQNAGVSPGDIVIAINGLRVTENNLQARLARCEPGQQVALTLFRDDELLTLSVTLAEAPADTVQLSIATQSGSHASAVREAWLAGREYTAE